jgi:hypothetical protein
LAAEDLINNSDKPEKEALPDLPSMPEETSISGEVAAEEIAESGLPPVIKDMVS